MRIVRPAVFLTAGIAAAALSGAMGSDARAQNAPFCLMTGSAQECDFVSMEQCLASKRGNADFCEPNNTGPGIGYSGTTRYPRSYSRAPQ